ncbi:hypothetical protein C3007_00190 [Avibacterium gallinarum]|uniref:hypothetical protein n=1 Tax=Avibacterium gallinarum TaxID=755 RepID=UPI000CDD26AD|nr:hypothetical protein [Avibacterium gallinarum]POY45414.1 hypothetical protein C3007_00190 [Avibacterium gallinarum]
MKLVEKRSTTIDDIEEFITTRITTIEFKANQLEKIFKEECQFISTESLAKLRSEPMDIFENSHSDYKKLNQQLNELRKSIHENIESNYSSWLEKNNSI